MSVESTILSTVEHTAEGAATSVIGGVVSASNPISAFGTALKVGAYIAGAALAAYCVYRLVSFVDQAAEDHAARATLTSQVSDLKAVNASNEAAFKVKLAENEIIVGKTNRLADELAALQSKVTATRENVRHGPSSSSYKPSPDDLSFLDGLHQSTR
jgi:hypothetical protein